MTKSEFFTKAHQIASFKDAEKLGNKIFRFLANNSYRTRFTEALKYLWKLSKGVISTSINRGKNAVPTLKQWDFLQRNRVDVANDYQSFCNKYTKSTASNLISRVIDHIEDGYTFPYKIA